MSDWKPIGDLDSHVGMKVLGRDKDGNEARCQCSDVGPESMPSMIRGWVKGIKESENWKEFEMFYPVEYKPAE